MRRVIPGPVLSAVADICARRETHATLDSLMTYAGAPGDPPGGSKPAKALEWLRRTNKSFDLDPLAVLGTLIENYMEEQIEAGDEYKQQDRDRILAALAKAKLQYVPGGRVVRSLATPSKTLEEYIRGRDIAAVEAEFNRALSNIEQNPREAVSAASNILESVCKVYIEEEGLDMPTKQDLRPVWSVVRKHLGFDPGLIEDKDLQQVLSGIISTVEGIGALRTHASSAHGAGKKVYRLEPRHARLAAHAAHTVALFVLETWQKRKGGF